MRAVFVTGILVVFALFLGVEMVAMNDGELGVLLERGQPTGEVVEPGLHVSVRGWREIAVVTVFQIRSLESRPTGAGVGARFAGVPVWLQWQVQRDGVLKFYRVASSLGAQTDNLINAAVIEPAFAAAVRTPLQDWDAVRTQMNQALQDAGIVVVSIKPK